MTSEILRRGLPLLAVVFFTGCAIHETLAPHDILAEAQLAVRQARESPAPEFAAAELREADRKLTTASISYDDRRFAEAKQLAEQAILYARLAEARGRAAQTHQLEQEMRVTVETLQRSSAPRHLQRSLKDSP